MTGWITVRPGMSDNDGLSRVKVGVERAFPFSALQRLCFFFVSSSDLSFRISHGLESPSLSDDDDEGEVGWLSGVWGNCLFDLPFCFFLDRASWSVRSNFGSPLLGQLRNP